MAASLIILDRLSKRYTGARTLALNEVSLSVASGEAYGFLGANGAGKTTTIRTLLGFLQPSSGSAIIQGHDVVRGSVAAHKSIGYLAGDVALYSRMTGTELLDYMASLGQTVDKAYRQQLIRMFEAETSKPIGTLSRGNRQKLGIIQAFMHRPDVLIMDEPTSGLDPLMQEAFFQLIHETRERGAAVFMSSHNFAEVQRACDRVGIIRQGRLIKEQVMAELGTANQQRFVVTFVHEPPLASLAALSGVTVAEQEGKTVKLVVDGDLSPLLRLLAKQHGLRLVSQTESLEQEFLQFYGEDA